MPRQQYRQHINYLIVLLRDDVDTDELSSYIDTIPTFKKEYLNTQKVSFYKNTLDYLIRVGKEYLRRIRTKQTRNSINKTRRGSNSNIREYMKTEIIKLRALPDQYSINSLSPDASLIDYMNDVLGELEPIHKKYLAMFENPPSSIKRARDPSSGGTRKNRRTH